MSEYDVVIVGGGPAGLTAAIYTGRANLKTLILEKGLPGGQIAQTEEVENYPGFPEAISGAELAKRMEDQARKFGAELLMDEVQAIERSEEGFWVKGFERTYRARAVILATGANPKKLGVPGEEKFYGRGVSTCATCDGFFYRGKEVVVVGGGDAAVEEGLFLTKFASKVTLIHRRGELRANKTAQARAFANPKMHFLWNTVVEEILGEEAVTGVRLRNLETGQVYDFKTDGVFVFIGHVPNTEFVKGLVALRPDGYVEVKDEVYTSVPGLFAAGDVADPIYRQLGTSVGAGTRAAMVAEKYLAAHERPESNPSPAI
ncbi:MULTISPECIES: thioredoxin-disulfide reductase [unclassified Meiothermus]|uniref:thioredoxin-disulfide reductase n=1 Tax=unclassified Meiothermus TaxID=370471 RepID=UPI000D7CB25D|nr:MULTISPECIES: thioredoxin-disulfide reductase [unclassified Meiothermus]PZA05892.1 thioredoxin-disulfide reductase [Meiothermus sp. Pnk-1]RYM39925.1 thioredoxin-disulfide reductase [Meiothermus sp. PNK-Is4]